MSVPVVPRLSVIVCAHNPHGGRLARTLAALAAQQLDAEWELLIVDNGSATALSPALVADWPALAARTRIVAEPELGLSNARAAGFRAALGTTFVLVDDDNVLAPGYLAAALSELDSHPRVGLTGGPVVAEYERPPEPWMSEFLPLLALRELGDRRIEARPQQPLSYPPCAPVGAGMVLRRECAQAWLDRRAARGRQQLTDRAGQALSSAGDNDIVMVNFRAGWAVSYLPVLRLLHLIPPGRIAPDYLARLNEGIQASWLTLLRLHGVSPWSGISPLGARLRCWRAWWRYRAWRSPAARIRWRGACGQFAGRAVVVQVEPERP